MKFIPQSLGKLNELATRPNGLTWLALTIALVCALCALLAIVRLFI